MFTKTVRLPYTLWYDGHDKIFRMDMSTILPEEHYEDGKKYVGKIRNVQVGGYNVDGDIQPPPDGNHGYLEVTEFATAVYNEQKHYVDITLKSFPSFNADGEIALYIDYELAKGIEEYITDYSYQKKEVTIIIPIRLHENPSKDPGRFNNGIGIDKMDVRNGFAYTVGASEEPVVFSFELIERDITDEFITNGQALDMVKNKSIESANLVANDSGLGLSLNWKSFGQLSWDNLKQYLGGSSSTEFTTTTLEYIIAMLNNTSENIRDEITNNIVTGLQSHINVQENSSKDIDVYYNADFYTTQGQHINEPRKLFTIPRSLLGGEGQAVDTESIKNSILSVIQQQIPNATTIKQEILADVNPRIPDKEVIKQEVLAAVPTSSYELTPGKMNAVINELDYATETAAFIDNIHNHFNYDSNLRFIKLEDRYEIEYKNHIIMTIPFSSLRELPIAAALTENVITETIKPTLDKSYYSKEEVDNLIKKLKEELTAEDHDTHSAEEHPQQ